MSESSNIFPVEWNRTTLGALAAYINGYAFKPFDWGKEGLPIIRIEQINNPDARCDYYSGPVPDRHFIDNGTLLFSWSATLTVLIWNRGPAYLNQHIFKVSPKEGVDKHFLFHLINFNLESLGGHAHGSTMRHIKRSDLLPYPVVVPSDEAEQRRIAEILDTLDDAIQKTEQLINKLKQIKQGLLHDLLTRGIDENGQLRDPIAHPEQFKDSVLGRIPKGWKVCALETVAQIERGKFAHRPRNDPRFYGGEFPFVQTGDITAAQGEVFSNYSQTLNARGAAVSRSFPENTIAITIAANIADTGILGIPMYFPDSVVGAIVHKPHNVRFVELAIRLSKHRLDARAPQSAQKNINLQDLRPLLISLPTPQEQFQIAEIYEAYADCINAERQHIQKLITIKKSLMHDLLTGKVRVTSISGEQHV